MADSDAVLRRLTDRLAPLERDLHRAYWEASTDASPETSAAKQRAGEAWLRALADPGLFAEVGGALAGGAAGRTRRALEQAQLELLANQIPEDDRAVAPVYYQSYLLGELLASQLDQAVREHAGGFVGRPAAFLRGLAA